MQSKDRAKATQAWWVSATHKFQYLPPCHENLRDNLSRMHLVLLILQLAGAGILRKSLWVNITYKETQLARLLFNCLNEQQTFWLTLCSSDKNTQSKPNSQLSLGQIKYSTGRSLLCSAVWGLLGSAVAHKGHSEMVWTRCSSSHRVDFAFYLTKCLDKEHQPGRAARAALQPLHPTANSGCSFTPGGFLELAENSHVESTAPLTEQGKGAQGCGSRPRGAGGWGRQGRGTVLPLPSPLPALPPGSTAPPHRPLTLPPLLPYTVMCPAPRTATGSGASRGRGSSWLRTTGSGSSCSSSSSSSSS